MPKAKSKKSEETRRKLIETARGLFEQKGFAEVSVRNITEAAGVAKGTFYLYFESKFDVLKDAAWELLLRMQSIVKNNLAQECLDYANQVGIVLDEIIQVIEQNRSCLVFFHSADMTRLLSETNMQEVFINEFERPIVAFIKDGIAAGQFRQLDAELYARILILVSNSVLESSMILKYPGDLIGVREALHDSILRILLP